MKPAIGFLLSVFLLPLIAAETLTIDFSREKESSWGRTKSVSFRIENGTAMLDGTTWDAKIWKKIRLEPSVRYRFSGRGEGKIHALLYTGFFKGNIATLNLSGEKIRERSILFTTPPGRNSYWLGIGMRAAKASGKVVSLTFTPEEDHGEESLPDREKMASMRPSPARVRGYTAAGLNETAAREMKKQGVDAVRISIPFDKQENNWETAWEHSLNALEKSVAVAKKYNLKYIPVLDDNPIAIRQNRSFSAYWENPELEKRMIRIWTDVVTRLKPYRDTIWAYDLYNEPLDRNQLPHPPKEWRPLAVKLVGAIRKIDPDCWLIYEPGPGGGSGGLKDLVPLPDSRIIYSSHFYTPSVYSHQGIKDIRRTDLLKAEEKTGIRYPGVMNGKLVDCTELDRAFRNVDEFLAKYPVPYYIGEFSAVRWAPGAEIWLRDVIGLMEKRGLSWSYHTYSGWPGWTLDPAPKWFKDVPETIGPDRRGETVRGFFRKN